MFRKIFKRFSKKSGEANTPLANISRVDVERAEVDRVYVARTMVPTIDIDEEFDPFKVKYRDEYGEMHMVDMRDDEAFDKVMSNRKTN